MDITRLAGPGARLHRGSPAAARRRLILSAAAVAGFCLAACGSTASPTATPATPAASPTATLPAATAAPTPTPAVVAVVGPGAADPITAVKDVVGASTGCTASLIAQPCPMTLRLAERIEANPFTGSGGGAAWQCRCQNSGTASFSLISQSGTTAYVAEAYSFADETSLRWTVLEVGGVWFVDDQDTGCATTSIYSSAYSYNSAQSPPAC
jgi:hypothetical protein